MKTENRKQKTENRKQKTENRKQKTVSIALIILSLLFIFSCKKHSSEKTDDEVVNYKVIGFMSYTETERSIIDFDFSKEDTISNDYTLERLEDGVVITVEDDEDVISVLKTDKFVEIYQNKKLVGKMDNQKRNDSDEPEIIETIDKNLDIMTHFLSREIILNELSQYIVSAEENIYILEEEKNDIYVELIYDSKIERIMSIKTIEKIDGEYEEEKIEYIYGVIEGTYIVVSKITELDTRYTFEKKVKTEMEIIEEMAYSLGIDVGDIKIVSNQNVESRVVPVSITQNSDISIVNYSNIYINTDISKEPRNSRNFKGGNKRAK